jgi:molecular chaperone HscB
LRKESPDNDCGTMDPFATLGLPRSFDVDLAALEKTHRDLSRALHPDRHVASMASERRESLSRAIEVNEAWRIVRDPIRRAESLLSLQGVGVGEDREPKAAPEFLMEMLEQREELSRAIAEGDRGSLRNLAEAIRARAAQAERDLSRGFADGAASSLLGRLGELRFYRRFLDEVSAAEDERMG